MLGMCLISYLVSNHGPVFVHGRLSFELRSSGISGGRVSLQPDIGIFRLPPVRPGQWQRWSPGTTTMAAHAVRHKEQSRVTSSSGSG